MRYLRPALLLCLLLLAPDAARAQRLSLQEARQYMLELINRDRAREGLTPVALDPVATAAAQAHTDEMVSAGYISHWDLSGRKPVQRYNEAGGSDLVSENVYLYFEYYDDPRPNAGNLISSPTFTPEEVERIEASYIDEAPPQDGHRRNILDPRRTHVGISFSRTSTSLANGQEFVNRYGTHTRLPLHALPGEVVRVSGQVDPGYHLHSISLGWEPLPSPLTPDQLLQTGSYGTPVPFVSYFPRPYESDVPVNVVGAQYSVDVPLRRPGNTDQEGTYYVYVWLTNGTDKPFLASAQTVLLSSRPTPPPMGPVQGDADGNGLLDIRDAVQLLRISVGLGGASPVSVVSGDVTGDGVITVHDVIVVLRRLVGLE